MKARIWSERYEGDPAWARLNARRIWRYKIPHRNGCTQGITLAWPDALAAVARHLESGRSWKP